MWVTFQYNTFWHALTCFVWLPEIVSLDMVPCIQQVQTKIFELLVWGLMAKRHTGQGWLSPMTEMVRLKALLTLRGLRNFRLCCETVLPQCFQGTQTYALKATRSHLRELSPEATQADLISFLCRNRKQAKPNHPGKPEHPLVHKSNKTDFAVLLWEKKITKSMSKAVERIK